MSLSVFLSLKFQCLAELLWPELYFGWYFLAYILLGSDNKQQQKNWEEIFPAAQTTQPKKCNITKQNSPAMKRITVNL